MRVRDFFPLGIATGAAFCNRLQETNLLINNLKNGKHTLLMASRRYGKSSLALHVLQLSGLPYVEVDFYMASNEKVIEAYLLNGVVELIGKALGPVDKLITSIKRYVKNLKPKLDISAANIKLEFSVDTTIDPATHVKESLLLLESLLEEKQQQAVLLLDEFQNVGVIAQGKGIEGAIRHVAQKTKYLTIIFSGSNRKLLKTMFEDETRPLYKLCWKMELHRIAAEHYSQQIQKAAKFAWQQELDEPIIAKIFLLTERHPYYLNKLCDKLWTYYGQQVPSIKQVEKAWDDILAEEKSDAIKEISLLSLNQKAVLLQLAKKTTPQLTSKEVVLKLAIPSSSIISALEKLEEKDVIERKEEGDEEEAAYRIINPVIKYYVLKDTVIVH